MEKKYFELRINRDFGEILSVYFDFLKQNIKRFTNIFLNYNGIFIVGLLVTSYLMVSGFVGLIAAESNSYLPGDNTVPAFDNYLLYIGAGAILFFFIFLIAAGLNFSISSAYMIQYEIKKGEPIDKKEVWNLVKSKGGSIIGFILLLIPIYLVFMVAVVIFAFIPLLGFIAQYIIQFFLAAWIGVSFYSMLSENKGVVDAFQEGWSLVKKSFWKSVGVNFILGILNGLLFFIIMLIPGVIVGIYTFHVVDSNIDVTESVVSMIVYTLALCFLLVLSAYAQCLSQFVNGILFYALHEKEYNVNTRSKIEEIGKTSS
ncbi:MAG: hypothetical protein AAFU74_10755 [Bacteroidota bacterium]